MRANPSRLVSRRAFTLVELLVVVAIIGVLAGLLLPAIQAARESGRRTQCLNQLRQLGVAASSYAADRKTFPGGMQQWNINSSVTYRGIPLFVELLPYMEYKSLLANWHYDNPLLNCTQGPQSNTAPVIPTLVCPSDAIAINPITDTTHGWVYGLSSYGGNGGTRSYFPPLATADGVFFTTGPGSEPNTNQRPVRPEDITDGLSHTLLFGERSHYDPNYDSFNDQGWGDLLDQWGWWGASADRRVIGHLTMSAPWSRLITRCRSPMPTARVKRPPLTAMPTLPPTGTIRGFAPMAVAIRAEPTSASPMATAVFWPRRPT